MQRRPMTLQGKQKLEAELRYLTQVERPAVVKAIEEARALGDISENAEYDAAKDRQAFVEGRIAEIQAKLSQAEVVDPSTIKSDTIVFGATVYLQDLATDQVYCYQIVGEDEADVKENRISIMSPLARALIGKRAGDLITVESPRGEREFIIQRFEFK